MVNNYSVPAPDRHRSLFRSTRKFAALFLILLCGIFQHVNATHFRYGAVSWERQANTNTVTFNFNQVWRTSYAWGTTIVPGATVTPGSFCFGDGQCVNLVLTVTSVNTTEDWFSGTATLTHTYASASTYTADFSNCCRLSSLQNNGDENFRTETRVILNNGDNASPVSSLPPIVYLPPNNVAASFQVPAIDPDGDPFTYSLSTATQQGGTVLTQPSGFSVSASGLATLNTVGKVVGQLYNASIRVTDDKGAAGTVDFIMQIANQANPPYFDYTNVPPPLTPPNNYTFHIQPGQTLTFNVTGKDNDPLDVVTVISSSLPAGSVLSTQVGTNPAQRVFTWTPTAAQLGTYILSFDLIDGQGTHAISPTYVNIVVGTDPVFDSPPTPENGSSQCIPAGIKYTAIIQAHAPDTAVNVSIAATSIPANANFSPNPTLPGNTTSGTLNWTPFAADWGNNDMTFVATDDEGNTTTLTYTLIVNSPPSFTSSQGNVSIGIGQTFTYVITATDPDIPFGDELEIIGVTIPAWLTLTDNNDGTYTLTGTPGPGDLGVNHVHLVAEDSFHHCFAPTEQLFDIDVVDPLIVDVQAVNTCSNVNNGAVSVAVSGGTGPYAYRWNSSGAGATDVSAETGNSITGLAPGTYTVTITDDTGLQSIATTIVSNTISSFTVSPDVTICPGGSTTLTASGADLYSWNTGETTASITVTPAATTTYTVTGYVNSSNLVANGDFSLGNGGFTSAYGYVSPTDNMATTMSGGTYTGLVPEGVYAVDTNAFTYHPAFAGLDHTTGTGNFMIVNGAGTPNTVVWQQTVNNILPNTTYYFSTWVTSVNPDSPAELNFSINGQPLGSTFTAPAGVTGTWVQFYQTWNSGSNTSADISIVNQNVVLGGNDFGLDDISFTTTCPDTRTVTVTVAPPVQADAGPDQNTCPGSPVTLMGTGGGSYLWSTGDTTANAVVAPDSTTTYTLTVTNAGGCVSTGQVTVFVGDTIPPVAVCHNLILYLDQNGVATISASQLDNGSIDKCGTPTLSASKTSFDCGDIGANSVAFIATDVMGNADTCYAMVYVLDTIHPVAVCQNITVQLGANFDVNITPEQVDGGSTDECGIVTRTVTPSTFNCFNVGPNTVTLTVSDSMGNSSSCTAIVTVEDTIPPTAVCQSITVTLDANGQASITAGQIDNESSDVCGIASITASPTTFDCSNLGDNNVTLTVTDRSGNVSTCTAIVTVRDNDDPVVVCKNITVQLDAAGQATITAADVDNGSADNCGITSLTVTPSSFSCADTGVNTVSLTATDASGNTASCRALVTVQDTVAPVIVCRNIILALDANGEAALTADQLNNGSHDACGIIAYTVSQSLFTCADAGANTVTLTGTDANGNTASCEATVTVADTTAPTAACKSITVQLDADGNASVAAEDIDNGSNDNCGTVRLSASQTSFTCANVGANTVTLTVTDANGNSSTCNATVTVEDNVAPAAVCKNITIQLDANGNATIVGTDIDNGSTDACGIAALAVSPNNFTCANTGANSVTLTVTDNNGNTSDCEATVFVEDTSAVVAVCKNATVYLDDNGNASVTVADLDGGSSAGCGAPSVTISRSDFNCGDLGANEVTLVVTGNNGHTDTCTAIVMVEDTTAPILAPCPADVVLPALTSNCFQNFGWAKPLYRENCSGNTTLSVTASDTTVYIFDFGGTLFASFPVGVTTVTQTVTDAHGNSDECSFTVTVEDRQNPFLTGCPANIVVNASVTQCSGQAFWNQPTASDNCPGVTLTGTAASGDNFPLGTTRVTYTATDAHGNSVHCSFDVTVRDVSGPQAICKNATVTLDANGNATITAADVDNGSYDNCTAVTLSVSPSAFTCANLGDNAVTLTATDANGNSSTCTATVTVRDVTPPVAICKNVTIALVNGVANVTAAQIDNGSYDNCGPVTLSAMHCNFTCANLGDNNVTLTVTDASGNVSTCTAVVTVTGGSSTPTVSCKNITIHLNANGAKNITADDVSNGASGACGSPVTLTVTPHHFTCANLGANNVTLTATDAYGNTATCTAVVTVVDTRAPVAICRSISVTLNNNGVAEITAADIDNGSTDNCSIASITASKTRFTCADLGANNVTLTVTDGSGNVSTCTAVVTVTGGSSTPTVSCKNVTIHLNANGAKNITADDVSNGASGACGSPVTLTVTPHHFTCANLGANNVTLTATDAYGNTATCTAVVTVVDTRVPVAICRSISVTLNNNGVAEITAADIDNGSTDNCSIASITASKTRFTCADLGANNVTLTVTDGSGNVSTCTAVVTVTGGNSTASVSCKNITVSLNANGVAEITAAQVSNGASGACGSAVTLTVTPHRFTCANVGANNVTLTATDAYGNTATCTAVVTVRDNTPPVAICRNKTVALVNGTATITAADINNGSYDNCGIASVTVSKTHFNCSNVGANQVTLTVTDVSGNVSTCTATVTVTGAGLSCSITSVPTSSCTTTGGDPNNLYIGYGPQSTHLQVAVTGGGPYTYHWSPSNQLSCSNCASPLFTPTSEGNYTFTVTVSNASGCTTTCTITICVLDIRERRSNGCGGYNGYTGKVYVCHVPPGNHNNAHTISVSVNAVSAHVPLHGGDHLGRCDQQCGANKNGEEENGVAELIAGDGGGFDMLVYPNPFHDQFHLRIESENDEKVEIRIFTLTGQMISEQKDLSANEDILLGFELATGLYMVEVKQGDSHKVVRLTKAP